MINKGSLVSFHKIVNGKVVGLEKEVFKVIDTDSKYWGICDLLLMSLNTGSTVYTTRESVGIAKVVYEQLSLF